ncbi:hypothetical protein QVD17_19544 [Tagetes erecta]|uniref:Uncharacterized protein n=1 Tax=Tagetes erecta TaxID=13708 RepID=A0AAD8KMH5_TARER|nr:hypothetical protein QVD17_19544 [Tagetes erecta]
MCLPLCDFLFVNVIYSSGTYADKALFVVLTPKPDFLYSVRINVEVIGSYCSTSMATICGGSMALMDADNPLIDFVAGLSVGLGLEDHLGGMNFKIAGTRNGFTAIQLDIKLVEIPLDVICARMSMSDGTLMEKMLEKSAISSIRRQKANALSIKSFS